MNIDLELLARGAAITQYQYVEVDFPTADTDVRIRHQMKVYPYTDVFYIVVKKNMAGDVYTGSLSLWSQQYIALKSSVPAMSATILLFTRSNNA